MAKAPGLGAGGAWRRIREGEEFDLNAIGEGEIELVRLAFGAVILGDDAGRPLPKRPLVPDA